MRFLNPSMLWSLPLAALPVLIHFLFSPKPFRLEFSSVFLLRRVGLARRRPAGLLKALVLLLRCLAVLALVAAFSRPVIESGPLSRLSGFNAGAGRPLSLAVLADRSYSMSASFGGRTRYDFAAGIAERVLGGLGGKDEAALVFFDESAETAVGWTNDPGAVSKALSASRPGYQATDYAKALERAYALLASRPAGRKKAVLVLSDSAQNGFAAFPRNVSVLPAYDPQAALIGLSFAGVPNAWIRATGGRDTGSGALELTAYSGGEGGAEAGEAALSVLSAAEGPGKVLPGRFRNGAAVFDIGRPGRDPAGRVALEGRDALACDDEAYFAFQWYAPVSPAALIVYGGDRALKPGGGAYFLGKFFGAGSGAGVRADFARYDELERARLGDYGVLILTDPPAGAGWTAAVKDYLSAGGGVLLAAAPEGRESDGRGRCAAPEAFGFKCEGAAEGGFFLAQARGSAFFGDEDFSGFDLSKTAARRIMALDGASAGGAPWLFRDESGGVRPALLYKQYGRGRLLVWTSSFDLGGCDLAAKPVFAPFMAFNIRKLLGMAAPEPRSAAVGGVFEGRLKGADRARVAVTAPDGGRSYVFAEGGAFRYGLTPRPGVYRWSAPPEAGAFAVNLDHGKGESGLVPAKSPPWRLLRPEEPAADFRGALYGVEISQFLLFLALALFLAEFTLSRKVL